MGVITKGGDQGYTSLFSGRRVLKSDARVMAYGWVDLLNSHLGVVLSESMPEPEERQEARELAEILNRMLEHLARKVQPELFNVGALLATEHESDAFSKIPRVHHHAIEELENLVKEAEKLLPPMRFFIMPRGNRLSSQTHVARAVCRQVETVIIDYLHSHGLEVVQELVQVAVYLNRLSDYLFILARVSDNTQSFDQEQKWVPHKT